MPLFKKFIYFIMIIMIILVSAYVLFYAYSLNQNLNYHPIKDYNLILDLGFKDLKASFAVQFIEAFSDMIVYVFTFKYGVISDNVKCYSFIILITSIPFIITLFQFLTFRGFQAIKLKIKKAKANPFYYRDYVLENKEYGNDNIEDIDASLYTILIPLRLLVIVFLLLMMPIILIIYLIFEIIGLFRGITNTGKALDFE